MNFNQLKLMTTSLFKVAFFRIALALSLWEVHILFKNQVLSNCKVCNDEIIDKNQKESRENDTEIVGTN